MRTRLETFPRRLARKRLPKFLIGRISFGTRFWLEGEAASERSDFKDGKLDWAYVDTRLTQFPCKCLETRSLEESCSHLICLNIVFKMLQIFLLVVHAVISTVVEVSDFFHGQRNKVCN